MRSLAAAILAVPAIALTYVPRAVRRSLAVRIVLVALLLVGAGAGIGTVAEAPLAAFGTVGGVAPPDGPSAASLASSVPEPIPPSPSPSALSLAVQPSDAPTPSIAPSSSPEPSAPTGPVGSPEVGAVLAAVTTGASAPSRAPEAPSAGTTPTPTPRISRGTTPPELVPKIVRFRPLKGASGVAASAEVSVRFTLPMNTRVTAAAFTIRVNGTPVTGRARWAENDTVLVVTPARPFPSGAKVTLAVARTAKSKVGHRIPARVVASFQVAPAAPTVVPTEATAATASAAAPWRDVELYYLTLMNCTRTGGVVGPTGACSGGGTGPVKPLVLDAGISDRVARPYAKFLATGSLCSHFADGKPGDRLARAGYSNWDWAENIGCQSTSPYRAILETHLYFQAEKATNGGHYRNMMNPLYDRVGIGIYVVNGTLRLVIDFYKP